MKFLSSKRVNERRSGMELLNKIQSMSNKVLVIHYSCESFFNLEGRTPRITSICIKNRHTNEAKAFSLHLQAQFEHVDLSNIPPETLDLLELQMLTEFRAYVEAHPLHYWVHWNMRNASYGFEALSNRSRIVGGSPISINDELKFDLPMILGKIYTYKFAPHENGGQLINTAKQNHISLRDALNGKEEAEAFEHKEFLKLHMSTMRKVEVIDRILSACESGSFISKSKLQDEFGLSFWGVIELIKNSPVLFFVWSVIVFVIATAREPIIQTFAGTSN